MNFSTNSKSKLIKSQTSSDKFSIVDSSIYEVFSSKLYDGVWYSEKSQLDKFNISEHFKTLLGYTTTDSLVWKDLILHQDLKSFTEEIQNISNLEYTHCTEMRFLHKNGSVLWMQTHIYSKANPDQIQRYIFIAFKDITHQKNNELKVIHQQQRDNDILNGSGIGTWEYNLIT